MRHVTTTQIQTEHLANNASLNLSWHEHEYIQARYDNTNNKQSGKVQPEIHTCNPIHRNVAMDFNDLSNMGYWGLSMTYLNYMDISVKKMNILVNIAFVSYLRLIRLFWPLIRSKFIKEK